MPKRLLTLVSVASLAALAVTGALVNPTQNPGYTQPPPGQLAAPVAYIPEDSALMPHRRPTPAAAALMPEPVRQAQASRGGPPRPATAGPAWVHPLASGRLATSCYRSPRRPGHGGIDIPQPGGTPIRAVSAGTIHAKRYESGGAGFYVVVRHDGGVFTLYMHLRAHSPLGTGASVRAGQTIGYVGRTGNATGNHLHFEVRKGGASSGYRINPAPFMRARGVNVGC